MRTLNTVLALILAIISSYVICSMVRADEPGEKIKKANLRVGTFDSRAVAVAFAPTKEFNQSIKQLMDEQKRAKAEGDEKKVKELEAMGKAMQQKAHMQAFSTASVSEILEHIKDQIPAIAKEAGVDVIVSKWDVVYQAPAVEFVDLTDLMIRPFHPSEKTLKIVESMKKIPPISLEEAKNIKD